MRKRAAVYCRVSTESEEQLASLREQESFFKDYTSEHGLMLFRIYADSGRSGTRLANRTAFAEMMQDAKQGAFEVLLVKDISRMARNVLDFLQTVRTIKKLGIECRFLAANCTAGDGEMLLTILAAVAQEESASLSKRVKFTKEHHARQGRVPNCVYGYQRTVGDIFHMTIDEKESEVVRRIYAYAADGWGSRKIARLLRMEGQLTKTGRLFAESSVRQILANPLYAGILRTHQTEVVDYLTGTRRNVPQEEQYTFRHPEWAIVSEDEWQAVQSRRKTGRKQVTAGERLLICGMCQKVFRRRGCGDKTVLSCSTRSRLGKAACANRVCVQERALAEGLYAWLDSYMTHARWEKAKQMAQQLSSDEKDASRIWKERRLAQETLLATGAIGRDEYVRRIALIDAQAGGQEHLTGIEGEAWREKIMRRMAEEKLRGRWIRKVIVEADGKLTVYPYAPLRKQSMLPDWEIR